MENDVIASTGDIRGNYEVIGLASTFFSTLVKKQPSSGVDIFDYLINDLKSKATDKGGNGIINIRVDKEEFTSGYSIGSNYIAYGTIIKTLP